MLLKIAMGKQNTKCHRSSSQQPNTIMKNQKENKQRTFPLIILIKTTKRACKLEIKGKQATYISILLIKTKEFAG